MLARRRRLPGEIDQHGGQVIGTAGDGHRHRVLDADRDFDGDRVGVLSRTTLLTTSLSNSLTSACASVPTERARKAAETSRRADSAACRSTAIPMVPGPADVTRSV